MSVPVRVVTNNLGAVPVFEDTANGGALSVVLEQNNLGAMPVRVLTTRTAGAVPIRYAGSGSGGGGDTTAPTLSSATIDTTGLVLTLVFDEPATGHDGFTLEAN